MAVQPSCITTRIRAFADAAYALRDAALSLDAANDAFTDEELAGFTPSILTLMDCGRRTARWNSTALVTLAGLIADHAKADAAPKDNYGRTIVAERNGFWSDDTIGYGRLSPDLKAAKPYCRYCHDEGACLKCEEPPRASRRIGPMLPIAFAPGAMLGNPDELTDYQIDALCGDDDAIEAMPGGGHRYTVEMGAGR